MISPGRQVLHGFSSYSRDLKGIVGPKNVLVEDALKDAFAPRPVNLYLDTDARTGQKTGFWPEGIVDAIARASIFIWWQSPSWFTKPTCRWELDCFLERADGIAKVLKAPADALRSWLIEPIHIAATTEEQWSGFSDEAKSFRKLYKTLNRQAKLDVTAAGRELDADKFNSGMHHFHCQLTEMLKPYGGIDALIAVEPEGPAFKRRWVEFAHERRILLDHDPPSANARTDLHSAARLRQQLTKKFSRDMAVAAVGGVVLACTARCMRGGGDYPAERSRNLAGQALWDEEEAEVFDDCARSEGLRLPTPEEAARLLEILNGPAEQRQRTGLEERASDIWCRSPAGDPAMAKGLDKRAPIFLVPERMP